MDFSRFFTTIISILSFPIGYLIAKYSKDELKQSNKLLSILKLILYLSIPFLLYFTKIVEVFGSFPGQIEIKTTPILLVCGYYFILFALVVYLRGRKWKKLFS